MKHLIITLIFTGTLSILNAQDSNVIGTWNIIEFTMVNNEETNKTNEDSLKENNSVWELILLENGTLKQTSNMRNGEIESQEGSWNTNMGNLILKLKFKERNITIEYEYILTEDIMTLKRSNPMGSMVIQTKFKRENNKL